MRNESRICMGLTFLFPLSSAATANLCLFLGLRLAVPRSDRRSDPTERLPDFLGAGHSRPGTHLFSTVVHRDASWVTPGPAGQMPAGSTVHDLQPREAKGVPAPRASRGDVGRSHQVAVRDEGA